MRGRLATTTGLSKSATFAVSHPVLAKVSSRRYPRRHSAAPESRSRAVSSDE